MCKVRKLYLLAANGLLWTGIGTRISVKGVVNYLEAAPGKLWWMIPLSLLVFAAFFLMFPGIPRTFFAWFYLGLGAGLLSAGIRFLSRWWKGRGIKE